LLMSFILFPLLCTTKYCRKLIKSSHNKSVMAELDEKAGDKEKSLAKSSRTRDGKNMKTNIHKPCSQGKQDTSTAVTTTEYCEKLQEWMWQYYYSYMNWQSWIAMSAFSFPPCFPTQGTHETPGATTWGTDMSNGDLRVQICLMETFGIGLAARLVFLLQVRTRRVLLLTLAVRVLEPLPQRLRSCRYNNNNNNHSNPMEMLNSLVIIYDN